MVNPQDYRLGVGIVLLNPEGKIFAGQRIDLQTSAWQMPQGGIDHNEYAKDAAMRELGEEVGTDKVEIIQETKEWIHYNLPPLLQNKLWNGRYKGQLQKWFLMRFTGKDSDINIQTKNPEFIQWRWENPELLIETIVDFKKDLYLKVFKEFKLI